MSYLTAIVFASALAAICSIVCGYFANSAVKHISPGFLASVRNGWQRTLCHFFSIFLICMTIVGCSNEFDKQYDGVMTSARTSFQNRDFDKAVETYFKAVQIRQTSNDRLNREKALKGFFESCYCVNPAERGGLLSKMKASLSSTTPDEQESFLFFSTDEGEWGHTLICD